MFLQKIKSDGIAHLSYIIGSGSSAAVIDPRRDIDIYLKLATKESANITHIFETHRNEDYVIGSIPLAKATGAKIYHGKALDFKYGNKVSSGDHFEVGDLRFEIYETPGHTFESISIALFDPNFGNKAVAVFTGDTLFIGDVGRTDFFPDQAEKVAGLLYDSIHNKLLPLGDQTILYPAHGAGSVCGSGMASREFSTIGYERMFNPIVQKSDRNDFIQYKVNEHHDQPPYFRMMEKYNLEGPPLNELRTSVTILNAEEFGNMQKDGMQIVDARSPEAICGAFIPGSMAMPLNMIPAFAGWLLSYEQPIGLVLHSQCELETAMRHFYRLGYDNVECHLAGGMHKWETSGKKYDRIPAMHASELLTKIKNKEDFILLDVRSKPEFEQKHLPGSTNIYVGKLPKHLDELPKDKMIVTFCGSGRRAVIAASLLKSAGFKNVQNCLGSMEACAAIGCHTE